MLFIFRTEDVLPSKEYVTTTRKYYPPEYDLEDNRENIYNLQKYKNGYSKDIYDNNITGGRIPYKSNLKKESLDRYRQHKNGLAVNGYAFRDDSGYSSRSNRLLGSEARNINGIDLENYGTRDISYKHHDNGLIHEDTLIDVIEDLQLHGKDDDLTDFKPGIHRSRYEKNQRALR